MLISLHIQLRRHRRKVVIGLAVLAVGVAALSAHAALMTGESSDHGMSGAVSICMVVGGSLAVFGVGISAVRRLLQRPRWLIPPPLAAAPAFVSASAGFLVRAGPPPLLSVLRL